MLFLGTGTLYSSAQDMPVRLTADEAVAAALSNNRNMRIAGLDEKAAAARYKETDALFLPQAGLSYSAMTTNNPLNAFGFKLQQKSIGSADFAPSTLNNPGGTSNFMTSIDVQQPLVNMDQLYRRKGARTEVDIYRLKEQRTKEATEFETRKAYMQLQMAYRAEQVIEESLQAMEALYKWTNDRVDQGMLSKADALNTQVQVRIMESRRAEAGSQVRNASDYLGLLMGRAPGPVYTVDTATATAAASAPSALALDSSLTDERADISAFRKSIEASDLMIRSNRAGSLPRLNAFGSYQLNDSRMFGFGAGAYMAGIRLSWDIFKGNSIRHRQTTLQLENRRLSEQYTQYKDQSVAELRTMRRKLEDASFAIDQQQAAVASAAESYRILRDRYEQGLAGSTDVLLAQTQLSQQRLALAQAQLDRDVTGAYIAFLTTSSVK